MEAKPAQRRDLHVTLFIPFPMAAECALRHPLRHPGFEGAGSLVAGPGGRGAGGAGGRRRWGGISCTDYKQQQRESGTSGGAAGSRPGRTPGGFRSFARTSRVGRAEQRRPSRELVPLNSSAPREALAPSPPALGDW